MKQPRPGKKYWAAFKVDGQLLVHTISASKKSTKEKFMAPVPCRRDEKSGKLVTIKSFAEAVRLGISLRKIRIEVIDG